MWVSKRIQDRINESKKTDGYWVEKAKLDYALELDKFRRVSGLSGKTLAEKLGTSAAYISRVFRGDTNLTIESMVKLARATGAKVEIKLMPELSIAEQPTTTHTDNIEQIPTCFLGRLTNSYVAQNSDHLESVLVKGLQPIRNTINSRDLESIKQSVNVVYEKVA